MEINRFSVYWVESIERVVISPEYSQFPWRHITKQCDVFHG